MSGRLFSGLDCSSKTIHLVVLDDKSNIWFRQKWLSSSGSMEERFCSLSRQFSDFLDVQIELCKNTVAAIENAVYVQNVKATIGINNVIAGSKLALHNHDVSYFPIDNRSWKKDVLGNGRASKEDIMQFAIAKWGEVNFPEQDYADAACIASWLWRRMSN